MVVLGKGLLGGRQLIIVIDLLLLGIAKCLAWSWYQVQQI